MDLSGALKQAKLASQREACLPVSAGVLSSNGWPRQGRQVGPGPPHPGRGRPTVLQSCPGLYESIACNNQTHPLPFPLVGPTLACQRPSLLLTLVLWSLFSARFSSLRVFCCARWSPPSYLLFPIRLPTSISGAPRITLGRFLSTVGCTCVICTVGISLSLPSSLVCRDSTFIKQSQDVK